MSRASILIVVGVLAILAPFSGLPGGVRTLLGVVLGCVVIGIGAAERMREQRRLIAAQSGAAPLYAPQNGASGELPAAPEVLAVPLPPEPAPEVAVVMDIAPVAESMPEPRRAAARKPRARKAAPKTMSPI